MELPTARTSALRDLEKVAVEHQILTQTRTECWTAVMLALMTRAKLMPACVVAKLLIPITNSNGTPDCKDSCAIDTNKVEPGKCGCNNTKTNTDSDGTPDCDDQCPNDKAKLNLASVVVALWKWTQMAMAPPTAMMHPRMA